MLTIANDHIDSFMNFLDDFDISTKSIENHQIINLMKFWLSSIFDKFWCVCHFSSFVFFSQIEYQSQCVILCWLTSWLSLLSICNHFFIEFIFIFLFSCFFFVDFFSLFFVLSHWKFSVRSDFRLISVGLKKKKWICVIP